MSYDREFILRLQKQLQLTPTGKIGTAERRALFLFQHEHGLNMTGEPDPETCAKLAALSPSA